MAVDERVRARGELLAAPVDAEDHVDGLVDAVVTLVVYGDYECPFTRGTHDVIRKLHRRGAIAFRYVFRHFPAVEPHPHALHAARAAEAAARVGRFWPMHDALFAHQHALDDASLAMYAAANGVSATTLAAALAGDTYDARIVRDVASAVASGVDGTPALFVQGRRYRGPRDSRALGAALRAASGAVSGAPARVET
jgi:protein-disulfide isomerase